MKSEIQRAHLRMLAVPLVVLACVAGALAIVVPSINLGRELGPYATVLRAENLAVSGSATIGGQLTVGSCIGCGGGATNAAGSNVMPKSLGAGSGFGSSSISDSGSLVQTSSAVQIGPANIATADFSITDGHPGSQAQLWVQSDDIHHVGSAGNNESISIVLRNNSTFDTTATTANSTGIDVIVAGGVDTGGNVLTATALAPNATCVSCNGGVAYAINSQFGTVKIGGPVDLTASASVGLGNAVQNFGIPGSTSTVARVGIGALPSVDGTGVQVKNTVTTSTLSGYEVGLDTTVNAGIRGGYLIFRGAAGNFGGNSAGMVAAAGAGFPFTTSAAGDLSIYSEYTAPIVFGADASGFTSALRITASNHLVQDASTGLPTLGAGCTSGTGSAIIGNDNKFEVTVGTTSTACTVTFKKTWTLKPICNITTEGGSALPTYTVSATAITITTNVNSGVYNVDCQGQPGSS